MHRKYTAFSEVEDSRYKELEKINSGLKIRRPSVEKSSNDLSNHQDKHLLTSSKFPQSSGIY